MAQQVLTGGISTERYPNWDSKGRIYYTDENGNVIPDTSSFVDKLVNTGRKLKATAHNIGNWINETNPDSEAYKQKANLVLGLATARFGVGATATKALGAKLAPVWGKKVGQMAAQNLGGGLVGGGSYGFGRGLIEGENPFKTAIQDGLTTAAFATLGGLALGNADKYFAGRKIRPLQGKKNLSPEERKSINNYYADYERGLNTVNKNDFIGKIELPSQGMKETIKQQPQKAAEVLGLSKSLKNADYLETVPEWHKNKFGSDKFYHIKNNGNEYIIANNPKNGKKYFHIIKDSNLAEPKSDGLSPNNIIPDYDKNLKSFMKNSKAKGQNSELLKLKHYTVNDFDEFKNNELGGHFFTNDDDYIEAFASEMGNNPNGKVIEAYLNLENPKIINAKANQFSDPSFEKPIIETAKNEGFDSVIFNDIENPYGTSFYVPFTSNQIKSVNNQGTFDPTNPNIYKSILGVLGTGEMLRRLQPQSRFQEELLQ